MALQKTKELDNGFSISYWRAKQIKHFNGLEKVEVFLAGYKDKIIRDKNVEAYIEGHDFAVDMPKTVLEAGNIYEQIYKEITKSQKETRVITPAVEEVKNPETGEIITPAQPAVTEEVETNWFADAASV